MFVPTASSTSQSSAALLCYTVCTRGCALCRHVSARHRSTPAWSLIQYPAESMQQENLRIHYIQGAWLVQAQLRRRQR